MSKRKTKHSIISSGDSENTSNISKKGRVSRQVDHTNSDSEKSPYFTSRTDIACLVGADASAAPRGTIAPVKDGVSSKFDNRPIKNPESDDETLADKTASTAAQPLPSDHSAPSERLGQSFYDCSGEDLARAVLGKVLVRRLAGGMLVKGRIVETEAYLGKMDKAAHSFKKKTDRNAAMFMDPGTAYVYNIYGMYCCMNISSQGEGCAVLLRALEPVEGLDEMARARQPKAEKQTAAKPKVLKRENLCDGPSKLCQALSITKAAINEQDMTSSPDIWLEDGDPMDKDSVVVTKRINIGYAEDWVDKPLRFYILDNKFVSKPRDKVAEKLLRDKV